MSNTKWIVYLKEGSGIGLQLLLEFVGADGYLTSLNGGYVITSPKSKEDLLSQPFVESVEVYIDNYIQIVP